MRCEDCGDIISEVEIEPHNLDEIADLMAEAARVSPHAAQAYKLLRETFSLPALTARQWLIAGRMGGLPL